MRNTVEELMLLGARVSLKWMEIKLSTAIRIALGAGVEDVMLKLVFDGSVCA